MNDDCHHVIVPLSNDAITADTDQENGILHHNCHHPVMRATTSSNAKDTSSNFSIVHEMYTLSKLAIPYIIIQWNLFIIFPYTAMMLGTQRSTDTSSSSSTTIPEEEEESATTNLAAFSLGSLLGNLTCLSILEGTLSVADTSLPRAYTLQHYTEMIYIILRTMIIAVCILLVPIIPLYYYSEPLLIQVLHQNTAASQLASIWIRIYFLGILPNLFFRLCMRFGMSQKYTLPFVVSTTISSFVFHPIFVHYLVTNNPNHTMGHVRGSSYALVGTQWMAALLLVLYLYFVPMQYTTTPSLPSSVSNTTTTAKTTTTVALKNQDESLNLKDHTDPNETVSTWYMHDIVSPTHLYHVVFCDIPTLRESFVLAIGGIGSMMEWWFFEVLCFIVGTFGIIPLCIHTIAYNLVPLVFMIPLGILGGLTVRIGHIIEQQIRRAQLLALYSMLCTVLWGIVITSLIYLFRVRIIQCFTNDPDVITGALQIWSNLCYYLFLLHVFAISQAILRALGKQWYLAIAITFCLYGITLPTIYYFSIIRDGQVNALWRVLPTCYAFLQVTLIVVYTTIDWSEAIHKTRNQTTQTTSSSMNKTTNKGFEANGSCAVPQETTPLLS
jgi:multidrug resistance protein, MATE family